MACTPPLGGRDLRRYARSRGTPQKKAAHRAPPRRVDAMPDDLRAGRNLRTARGQRHRVDPRRWATISDRGFIEKPSRITLPRTFSVLDHEEVRGAPGCHSDR
jgi:hypothetical protein